MQCNTAGFPHLTSYATVREHFDSVEPWRSKYNPEGDERPIGIRAVKHNDGRQFNKAMRELSDGSIAFRLFDTDCVIWHPDETLSIEGYPSMSTNAFIGVLTPSGVTQTCRHQMYNGRRGESFDPVLHLAPTIKHSYSSDPRYPDVSDRSYEAPAWSKGIIIQCERRVKLNYSVAQKYWVPAEPDRLEPFHVPVIDKQFAREAAKKYHLATLKKVVNAVMALAAPPPPPETWAEGSIRFSDMMAALEREQFMEAIAMMPRGESDSFGKVYGTPTGIKPGFLRKLRDHIYDHEGVITREDRRTLTPSQYVRYVADSNRFD